MSGDLAPVPEDEKHRDALERARYLTRVHPDLRDNVAIAVAYRELGYTASGIAQQEPIDVSESTVKNWLARVAVRHGLAAIETKSADERDGQLPSPTTETLIDELSVPVLGDHLALAQSHPSEVPDDVDPCRLEQVVEAYVRDLDRGTAATDAEDRPDQATIGKLRELPGGWFDR